jgi:magnesium chelatase family protein
MSVATTRAVALRGTLGHLIDVQVDVSHGMVATVISGRAEPALAEARDRVRMAVTNSGLSWPNDRRTTVLLAPADLPKSGTHFDLAIAVALLAVTDQLPGGRFHDAVFVGELALDGGLRCVPGVLPMTLAAAAQGATRVFVPEPQAAEAALVPGIAVFGMRSLAQVVAELCGVPVPEAAPVAPLSPQPLLTWRGQDRTDHLDLADLDGLEDPKFSLEVAAAGGHHLMLHGPKGTGKTSLAERLPGLLPDLEPDQALELNVINSLAGVLTAGAGLPTRPPFCAPHHHASRTALLGGGTGRVRPGEVSRAHHGVLFLDEFPLLAVDVFEALRQPLESGEVSIARGEEAATYPARGMVVLACNPCPCGEWRPDLPMSECRCGPARRRDYAAKMRGPLIDRIDIVREVREPTRPAGRASFETPSTTAAVAQRVRAARERQAERYAGTGWRLNAHVPGPVLERRWPLAPAAAELLREGQRRGRLSRRGLVRASRVAWTLADLWERARPGLPEAETALALRSGVPLSVAALRRAG